MFYVIYEFQTIFYIIEEGLGLEEACNLADRLNAEAEEAGLIPNLIVRK